MKAAISLRASSDAFYRMGRETDANFCREMASSADRLGEIGNALYLNWAGQMADRVIAKSRKAA